MFKLKLLFVFVIILTIPFIAHTEDEYLLWETTCSDKPTNVSKMAFIPPGDRILNTCGNKLQIRDAYTGEQIGENFGNTHHNDGKWFDLDISSDGKRAIVIPYNTYSEIYDVEARKVDLILNDVANGFAPGQCKFSADGSKIYALNPLYQSVNDGCLWILDSQTLEVIKQKIIHPEFDYLDVSKCGRYIAIAQKAYPGEVVIYDAETLEPTIDKPLYWLNSGIDYGEANFQLKFSHDGSMLGIAGDGGVRVWNTESREEVFKAIYFNSYYSLDFSLDDQFIIFGGSNHLPDAGAVIYKIGDNDPQFIHKYYLKMYECINVSPNNDIILGRFGDTIQVCGAVWEPSSINTEEAENNIKISPIPGKDLIEVHCDEKILSIEIIDMSGHIIRTYNEHEIKGGNPYQIDISNIPNGTYILQINAIGKILSEKIIVGR
jgi:WD40 repeat protein